MWITFDFCQSWVRTILDKSVHYKLCQGQQHFRSLEMRVALQHLQILYPHADNTVRSWEHSLVSLPSEFCKCCSRTASGWIYSLILIFQKRYFRCFPSPPMHSSIFLKRVFKLPISLILKHKCL